MTKAKTTGPTSAATIDVKLLRRVLKDVGAVVEARNTIPILSAVVIEIEHGSMRVKATDLDLWAERRTDAVEGDRFSFAVDAGVLNRIAGKLPDDVQASLTLDHDGRKLRVAAGRSRFDLPVLPTEDFPDVTGGDWDTRFDVSALVLGGAIGRVRHAISTEETRYYLNGIFAHAPGGESLTLAATDGHRLGRMVLDLPDGAKGMPDVIIPNKTIKVLLPLLDQAEGPIAVAVTQSRIRFEVGETTLTSKLIDGTFPDYTRVIPTGNAMLVQVGRVALAEAIGRVAVVSTDKAKAIRFDLSRDLMTLTSRSIEHGLATEEIPCRYDGSDMSVGFNAKFMLDTIGQLTLDEIEIKLADNAAAPSLWRDSVNGGSTFVIMPMKV